MLDSPFQSGLVLPLGGMGGLTPYLRRTRGAGGSPSYTLGVTSFAGVSTRNDFSLFVGYKFTVASAITLHSLGRRKLSGNSGSHRVLLWDATTGLFLAGGKADLSTGVAGADVLDPLVFDIALPAGSYHILSQEFSGGDAWLDSASATMAAGITLDNQAYAGTPGTVVRSDFTGRLGFKFTPTGSQTITHLGRYKIDPTETGSHTVYLSDASGTTLGSATVSLSGQPTGMVYAALGSPVALTGGTAYYLASGETFGGDVWFDSVGATLASGFTLNNRAYHDGSYHDETAGVMWPVGFKFGSGQAGITSLTPGINNETSGVAYSSPQFEFY